jgi:hypothetical protein
MSENDDNNGEVIQGTAVEVSHPPAVVPPVPPSLAVIPTVGASELVQRLDVIRDASEKAMTEGVDYGKIPGTDKPTLLKPGAEKLGVLFQLDVQLTNEKVWGPGDHLTVISRATVFHAPTGARLGFGEGVCSTRERKYAYRRGERVCPACEKPAIIKGKAEYGGGWVCFKKRDGCGSKFSDGDPTIEKQQVGDVENPDLPDLWNTAVKMAEKRARVDAVLAVTGASALFTQDIEDAPRSEPAEQPPPEPKRPEKPPLHEESAKLVLEAIGRAKMGTNWVRSQLVAIGVESVPEGPLMKSTILGMTPEQAVEMVKVCDEAAENKVASK